MRDKHQIIEEPDEVRASRPVLKTNGVGDSLVEFNPDTNAESIMLNWLDWSRRVYNYALAERRDWIKSRSGAVNACSLKSEYIISADTPYPNYYAQKRNLTAARKIIPALDGVHSQVLQETLARLDKSFRSMQDRGFGFPRFKKYGQMRSLLFPQFKANPVTGWQIKLPKIGVVPIVRYWILLANSKIARFGKADATRTGK